MRSLGRPVQPSPLLSTYCPPTTHLVCTSFSHLTEDDEAVMSLTVAAPYSHSPYCLPAYCSLTVHLLCIPKLTADEAVRTLTIAATYSRSPCCPPTVHLLCISHLTANETHSGVRIAPSQRPHLRRRRCRGRRRSVRALRRPVQLRVAHGEVHKVQVVL